MDKLTRNMNVPLTEKQYQKMQEITDIEDDKNNFGRVTTATIMRKLIDDFIKNYDFKETK
jgi:hypothetical protein